jgi:hypothetical protein
MLQLIDEDTKKEAKKKKSKKKRKRADNQPSLSAPETASLPPFGAHIRQMMTGFGDGFYTRPETAIQIQHAVQLYMKAVITVAANLPHLAKKGEGKQKQQPPRNKQKLQRSHLLRLLPQECDSFLRWKAMKNAQTKSAAARFVGKETALEVLFSDSEDEVDEENEDREGNALELETVAKVEDKERVMARLHERLRFANDRTKGMDYDTYMSFAKCREANFLKERKSSQKFWDWLTDARLDLRGIDVALGQLDARAGAAEGATTLATESESESAATATAAAAASGGAVQSVQPGDVYPVPTSPLIKLLGYLAYDW